MLEVDAAVVRKATVTIDGEAMEVTPSLLPFRIWNFKQPKKVTQIRLFLADGGIATIDIDPAGIMTFSLQISDEEAERMAAGTD